MKRLLVNGLCLFAIGVLLTSFPVQVTAQYFNFNHPELDWFTLETEHFQVHFHQEAKRTARVVAKIAEDIYAPVTDLYQWKPDGKIHRFFIEDDTVPAPDTTATNNLLHEHLESVLNTLPPREARILQLRYGLVDGQHLTLNEVGRKMGVTRERVRQIEAQALRRLRTPSIQRTLRSYLD